jgi:DNA-directed RNA polymerase sigma subunit (sigma70/sigma32)|tara:strand:+ start:172 stop:318 length:147 start_codon:yes stop_codon:yes gene_type:complete
MGWMEKTRKLSEIGRACGVSREWASQIRGSAPKKIKQGHPNEESGYLY